MFECSTLGNIALLVFIVAMTAIVYIAFKINLTLVLLRNIIGDFKYLTASGLKFGLFSLLAKIIGIRRGGDVK